MVQAGYLSGRVWGHDELIRITFFPVCRGGGLNQSQSVDPIHCVVPQIN